MKRPATDPIPAIPLSGAPNGGRLQFPPRTERSSDETRELLRAVRSFQHGDPDAVDTLASPPDDLLPALLHPFRDTDRVRIDYPLFLPDAASDGADRAFAPLADLLGGLIETVAPAPDEATILKHNLARLERSVRAALAESVAPVDAARTLEQAGQAMLEELSLKPASAESLRVDLARLVAALPSGGRFLPLGEDATLHLLLAAAREAGRARRAALSEAVHRARATLRDILRLERSKRVSPSTHDALREAIGATGAARVDTDALARLLESRPSSRTMDRALCEVIEHDSGILDGFLAAGASPLITVIGADADFATADEEVTWRCVDREEVCRAASEAFDRQAEAYAELFAALRTARLLEEGAYDMSRHERRRAAFDWKTFTRNELLALPPVVAIESAPHLAGAGMLECSRLLLSGRPAEIVVRVQPARNPAALDDAVTGYRFELAYLGISHREILVHQSSAARPEHLTAGFRRSLGAATGSMHVVTSGLSADGEAVRLGAWMHAGAALGGRAHPFIHYDPEAGATWARRLDLDGNPQPEADWPVYELAFEGDSAEPKSIPVAFTFADFLLLEPRFRDHFRVIPDGVPEDELTPLADRLARAPEDVGHAIPFVWAADANGCAHRLVVDRVLERACRDRLDYWRTLQELAGIRNEHVREAVERERARLEDAFAAERTLLAQEHEAALAQVRQDESRAVLRRLAQSLLGIDVDALAATLVAPAPPVAPPVDTAPAVAEPDADETEAPATKSTPSLDDEGDDGGDEEPWIDSVLCTTCNDCMGINPRLFVYNGNKQAIIGDARAGTYAQLVQAAEKCPARCIHPGRPLDPDEPGLDALVERARPFNT